MTLEILEPTDDLVLYTACPLCDSEEMSHLLSHGCTGHPLHQAGFADELHWYSCERCGHVFRNGYFTDDAAARLFAEQPANLQIGGDMEAYRLISARMVNRVLSVREGGTWLDVGFGAGHLLFAAAEFGFRAVGCDLRRAAVESVRMLGIEAYCCDIVDLTADSLVSVVSMADVLEHIPYPKTALVAANRLLEPGGALLVSMPNFDTTVWRILDIGGVNPYWAEIEHYHNFSRRRLYELLAETGFEVVSYGVSERYRTCMEVLARKLPAVPTAR
jgi:protein O-GlcNAc transferase